MAHFIAFSGGWIEGDGFRARCALGKGGVTPAAEKREGDGASPIGAWPARRVWYRPDKGSPPETGLPVIAMQPSDGWCDAPEHPLYNRWVPLPFPASHERLWREDGVYDLVVELGYNDSPPIAARGSAIFLHVARAGYEPTEGCIALAGGDLRQVLKHLAGGSIIEIRA
ncbi:L,D-transpeptidase family protein [Hyphomonas sp. WL0036]|uniref:L,D-transpeptidase family protein n=1 Tax=Hyphomonas sediminis TaxID=2866160 RepID=UPI001C7FE997|nr:L,D-transpeptidase family protein [Hyphomonas sediminis]MBY9065919.1 L,D-transpeptidase family protein [Hyphomonas sediminis]